MILRCATLAAAILLPLFLAGCETAPGTGADTAAADAAAEVMAKATLPAYAADDTWTYGTDGDEVVERVVSVDPDGSVLWAATDGRRWVSNGDPLLPPLRSLPEAGPRIERRFEPADLAALSLFPLERGKSVAFTTEAVAESDGRVERTTRHECEVRGPRAVTVPAGDLMTVEIFCRRGGRFETLYYSPDMRAAVLELRDVDGRMERKELLSHTPGAATPDRPALPGDPKPQEAPVNAEPLVMVPDPAPAPDAAAATEKWTLQLGAMSSKEAAEKAWMQWRDAAGTVLPGAPARVVPAGSLWRLTVGAFPTRDAAAEACARLKAQGLACIVRET